MPLLRFTLRAVALLSGLCALSVLALPLLLALLMLLFDSTARGLMIMLGSILHGLGTFLPAGNALPPYRSLPLDPAALAFAALLRIFPCLLGLVPAIVAPERRASWLLCAACWCAALPFAGRLPVFALLPGIVAALLLAVDAGRRSAA
ncbi:hypothetical protein NFI95_05600 [Acetobacteraceae bacterium KSS8]|uniref:Uncharacterized protein n=1 Tax=Endosaccharibacter trunci TaxID=2812733 RepID=A0ABT1W4W6_9PROT|nr:hypothetical protein [Acetobacteraceae bacterium KSS8]